MCPRRIEEDHKSFRDVVGGRIRKALRKWIKTGNIFRNRGKNGKLSIPIQRIDIPHIVFGENPNGVGRGNVKPGDVIGKDDQKGEGQGNQAGQEEAEGIVINLDMEEVLKFMQEELALPNLKPKEDECIDEIKIKYNNISLVGPESLRHTRRTMLQALKRLCSTGEINKLYSVPGYKDPVKLITPINSDKRYRQYKEVKSPSSNALIIYARDGSASMDQNKCDVVSDMAWWIDVWIRKFYKRVERMFVWHDVAANEVSEDKFYKYRYGGGTTCSSALKLIAKQFENRFPPNKWNIFIFYFTDGENWANDNELFVKLLKDEFGERIVNLFAITQIYAYDHKGSVMEAVDRAIVEGELKDNVKTTEVPLSASTSDEARNKAILKAVREILGAKGSIAEDAE
jgi:uncharacterized sporulation protein YeaH/YhbH (DUF444 family)